MTLERRYLYRCYDRDTLLYIGVTGNINKPLARHRRTSSWHTRITFILFEEYALVAAAFRDRADAVVFEMPLYNGRYRDAKLREGALVANHRRYVRTKLLLPFCSQFIPVTSGQAIPVSTLLITGNCILAGDKIFGNYADTGFNNTGSANWVFSSPTGDVTQGFQGALTGPGIGTFTFQVQVNPVLSTNLIDDVQKDFTFNTGNPNASGTLSATSDAFAGTLSCTRNGNPANPGNCPVTMTFAGVKSLTLNETLNLGPTATATALTDTISQVAASQSLPR